MQKRYYSEKYKLHAIDMVNKYQDLNTVVEELGIRPEMLSRWRKEYEKNKHNAFNGSGGDRYPKDKNLVKFKPYANVSKS